MTILGLSLNSTLNAETARADEAESQLQEMKELADVQKAELDKLREANLTLSKEKKAWKNEANRAAEAHRAEMARALKQFGDVYDTFMWRSDGNFYGEDHATYEKALEAEFDTFVSKNGGENGDHGRPWTSFSFLNVVMARVANRVCDEANALDLQLSEAKKEIDMLKDGKQLVQTYLTQIREAKAQAKADKTAFENKVATLEEKLESFSHLTKFVDYIVEAGTKKRKVSSDGATGSNSK